MMLLSLLIVALMAATCQCCPDCPPENRVTAQDNPDQISITTDNPGAAPVIDQLITDPTMPVILNPATGFVIEGSIAPANLDICELSLEGQDFENITIILSDSGDSVLARDECTMFPSSPDWNECLFTFSGVTGVAKIEIILFDGQLEMAVRNLNLASCVETGWCSWSPCSATCGPNAVRERECKCPNPDPDQFVCDPSGPTEEPCEDVCCPSGPSWGEWSDWSDCDADCGPGERTRSRQCMPDADCPDCEKGNCRCDGKKKEEETEDCEGSDLTPAEWGTWSEWSDCDGECNKGSKTRSRECLPAGDCPNCTGPDDCECRGDDEETEECDAECEDLFVNHESDVFYTKASHNRHQSHQALKGNGIWKSKTHQDSYWLAAVDKESCCRIYSIEFTFKFVWEAFVEVQKFGSREWEEVTIIEKPDDKEAYEWISSGLIMLPDDVQKVKIYLQASMGMFDKPQLKDVEVTICCSGERDPCQSFVTNNEDDDLKIRASKNKKDASLALSGSGSYWSPGVAETEYWFAILINDCCGIYSVQFEVYQTWEVDVAIKEWDTWDYEIIQTVFAPMRPGWYQSDVIMVDDGIPEPRSVRAIRLCVWPGVDDENKPLIPQMRNVVITLCCDSKKKRPNNKPWFSWNPKPWQYGGKW